MVETPARQQHNRAVWLQQQRERQRTNQDAANVQVVEESPVKEGVLGMHLHSYTHLQVHAHTHTHTFYSGTNGDHMPNDWDALAGVIGGLLTSPILGYH